MLSFFFFKQKTAYEMRISDWSSDVCSSDLPARSSSRRTRMPLRRSSASPADQSAYAAGDQGRDVGKHRRRRQAARADEVTGFPNRHELLLERDRKSVV